MKTRCKVSLCLSIGITIMVLMSQGVWAESTISAQVKVGQAQGQIQILPESYLLKASVQKLADYTENWVFPAAVLDYMLPQPKPLAQNVNRVSLSFKNPAASNSVAKPMLRILIRDQRGHVYAVGTRLDARQSELPLTDHLRTLQSYDWNINEMGRIDPWVMMRVKPQEMDCYDAPQAPLNLVGFRLVLQGQTQNPCEVTISKIIPLTVDEKAEPYWQIDSDRQWIHHIHKPHDRFGRYGWGPVEPGPYLKASDLRLHDGKSLVSWEILNANDWDVLASDQQVMDLTSDTVIQLPLLEVGTYRMKMHVIDANGDVQPRYLVYVVLRNSRGAEDRLPLDKPLGLVSSANSNVFANAEGASVSITSTQAGQVNWSLQTSDGLQVASGQSTQVDLFSLLGGHHVLWLKAQLMQDGKVVDELDRVLGLRSAAPVMPVGEQNVTPKVQQFAGKLRRVKGDWNEGATPVASESSEVLKQFHGWLDDAVDTGYNIVELSAPWYDLNPLPEVYQFEYLDKLIALAQERELKVTLRIHPLPGQVPGYVDRQLMQDQAGFAHGIWSGNVLFSPAGESYRKSSNAYMTALAARYRNHPAVLGYTIESLFFDHDMIDMPWLGKYVDYSQAMRRGFIAWLQQKYGGLSQLNKVYNTQSVHWEQIEIPQIHYIMDADGRPMPHQSPLIRDWLDYKVAAMTRLRMGWFKAVRLADPAAFIGVYITESTEFYMNQIKELGGVITYGSMESQYPRRTRPGMPGRFEPHSKIARTAMLVDVGVTNLLMIDQPGMHGLFNYWAPQWRVKDQPAPVTQAEGRLKTWFGFIDQITQSIPLEEVKKKQGAYLICDETLLYEHGHMFYGRIDDYLKPFEHHAAQSDIQADALHAKDVVESSLQGRPWVYIPYSTDLLSDTLVNTLKNYVQQGGTLLMEAGSGKWSLNSNKSDVLSKALGLGDWQSLKNNVPSVVGVWKQAGFLTTTLKLRTQPWNPPINDQPTPWIHNIAGGYLQYGTWAKAGQGIALAISQPDGKLIMSQHSLGAGKILAFSGVVDWLNSPRLLQSLEASITGHSQSQKVSQNSVQLIMRQFEHGRTQYLVGRRFISQNDIDAIKSGKLKQVNQQPVLCKIHLRNLKPAKTYKVADLLDGHAYSSQQGATLMGEGLALQLKPGQAFVLKFEQE